MLILIVILACFACFVVGFVIGDGKCSKTLDEAMEHLNKASRFYDECESDLRECTMHEANARKYLEEARDALEKADARIREEITGGAWVEIGGSYEEPPETAGSSPDLPASREIQEFGEAELPASRDPERGGARAEERGTVCGSDAAGSGEADFAERSET